MPLTTVYERENGCNLVTDRHVQPPTPDERLHFRALVLFVWCSRLHIELKHFQKRRVWCLVCVRPIGNILQMASDKMLTRWSLSLSWLLNAERAVGLAMLCCAVPCRTVWCYMCSSSLKTTRHVDTIVYVSVDKCPMLC
jgi:hypothetical protein